MRYGIFSDVHSNLEALEAVLLALRNDGVDELLCGGDLVGYGADPAPCLKLIQSRVAHAVCGNHDRAAARAMPLEWFDTYAREAVEWTMVRLPEPQQAYLKGLPLVWKNSDLSLAHGGLFEPEEFHYVLTPVDAQECLTVQETPAAFIGHTHAPGIFIQEGDRILFSKEQRLALEPRLKYLVNVGSVGQPRDGDPRACYCLYDSTRRTLEFRRVDYPMERTQEKIRSAGLPEFLAHRLELGY